MQRTPSLPWEAAAPQTPNAILGGSTHPNPPGGVMSRVSRAPTWVVKSPTRFMSDIQVGREAPNSYRTCTPLRALITRLRTLEARLITPLSYRRHGPGQFGTGFWSLHTPFAANVVPKPAPEARPGSDLKYYCAGGDNLVGLLVGFSGALSRVISGLSRKCDIF